MNRKCIVMLLLLAATVLVPASLPAQTKAHRVVFALTSGDEADWNLTLGNIRNLLTAAGPDGAEIEVVAYGPGLSIVKKGSSVEQQIIALLERKVRFVACENSLRSQHVSAADLIAGVGTVPAGIFEVVSKQEQGWSYIKAGR